MASCVGNIRTKNYQNLVIGFQVTVKNVGDVFGTQCRERVETLIELYQSHICLWDMKTANYKIIAIRKKAKKQKGTHFGLSGDLCVFACMRNVK